MNTMIKKKIIGTGTLRVNIRGGKIKTRWLKSPKSLSRGSKTPRHTKKPTKTKIWSMKRADDEFRLVMLKSVPHRCAYEDVIGHSCDITDPNKLTVSHYFGRAKKGTRFMMENCILLCRNHHYWDKQIGFEFQKQRRENKLHGYDGLYTIYMKGKLGYRRFNELESLAAAKIGPKKAIQEFQESLKV